MARFIGRDRNKWQYDSICFSRPAEINPAARGVDIASCRVHPGGPFAAPETIFLHVSRSAHFGLGGTEIDPVK